MPKCKRNRMTTLPNFSRFKWRLLDQFSLLTNRLSIKLKNYITLTSAAKKCSELCSAGMAGMACRTKGSSSSAAGRKDQMRGRGSSAGKTTSPCTRSSSRRSCTCFGLPGGRPCWNWQAWIDWAGVGPWRGWRGWRGSQSSPLGRGQSW